MDADSRTVSGFNCAHEIGCVGINPRKYYQHVEEVFNLSAFSIFP